MTDFVERTDTFMADAFGADAFRVGGSVRDELLGRAPKDADYIVTGMNLSAVVGTLRTERPDAKVAPLEDRDRQQFGWRFSARGLRSVEIALPRREENAGDGRSQRIVVDPNITLEEDAQRRDFTFNALYRPCLWRERVIDPTGRGVSDLMHRLVNVTHADSFRDDPLRTLRALRFVSTLGYELGPETRALMALHAEHVTGLLSSGFASGTVFDELSKMLMGQDPAGALRLARDTGVLARILPELAPMLGFDQASRYHDLTTDEHTFKALETAAHVDAPLRVRWALLFHDSGKPASAWIGKDGRKHYYAAPDGSTRDHEVEGEAIWRAAADRLTGMPRDLREDVARLIRHHMVPTQKVNAVKVRRNRVRFGDALLRDLYLMRLCDLSGKGKANREFLANVAEMEKVRARAERDGVPVSAKDLHVGGKDLIAMGCMGRSIGRVLDALLDEVVARPETQTMSRDWQMRRAEKLAAALGREESP